MLKRLLTIMFVLFSLGLVINFKVSAEPVTIASWGGAYTESQKLGPGNYASKKTGIKSYKRE